MSNGHAFLPPSGASVWSKCALWATMNQRFPQQFDSSAASEGTAAHWVGKELITTNRQLERGLQTPNGAIVTDEMLEGGDLFADTVRARTNGVPLHLEETLKVPFGDSFGTPDCWALCGDGRHIEIFDYKFGFRFVDEFWNPQGLCYLAGIVDLLCTQWKIGPGMIDQFDMSVSFTIVQPRCYYRGNPVRTHTFRLIEARPHFNDLANMAEAALLTNPTATTNENCCDCPGRHACPALQQAAYSDAEFSNARTPVELTPAAAALELKMLMRALERLEARVDGLKELTLSNIKSGKPVPYFRLEPGYGRTQWTIPDGQIISIGKMFSQDLSKPGTVTPAQAGKMGIPESVIQTYSFKPSTSTKLVAENPTDAPRVFGRASSEGLK